VPNLSQDCCTIGSSSEEGKVVDLESESHNSISVTTDLNPKEGGDQHIGV